MSESAAHRPLMLTIEDLHWADTTTDEFLTFLLEHIAGARVLLVCTYRPDFVSTWSRKSYHSVITLPPLAPPEGRQMLTALLGTASDPGRPGRPHAGKSRRGAVLPRRAGAVSTGNRRHRAARGPVAAHGPGHGAAGPRSVEEVLMARIDRLPEGAKSVLQMGAVIGRELQRGVAREDRGARRAGAPAHLAALTRRRTPLCAWRAAADDVSLQARFYAGGAYRSLLTPGAATCTSVWR